MNCERCRRGIENDTPVYRIPGRLGYSSYDTVCEACTEKHNAWRGPHWRELFLKRKCQRCSRAILARNFRLGVRYIACSQVCRQSLHNEAFRRRHPRYREAVTCKVCNESFTPKRADAVYCSTACKQSAYRNRQNVTAPLGFECADERF